MMMKIATRIVQWLSTPRLGKLTETQVKSIESHMGENFPKFMREALLKPTNHDSYRMQRKALAEANQGIRPLELGMLTQDGILDKDYPVPSEARIKELQNNELEMQKDSIGFYERIKDNRI